MRHFTNTLFATLLLLPMGLYAQETKGDLTPYLACKQAAVTKRENTMRPALAVYEAESTRITNETKTKLDNIKWYVDSLYKKSSEKILRDASIEMIPVNGSIARTRLIAQSTWKAEDALCELSQSKKATNKK